MILERLGYDLAGYHQFRDMARREVPPDRGEVAARAVALMDRYDGGKDTPFPILFRELDEAFPGARFIHVARDPDAWIASAVRDFGEHPNAMHQMIYGSPHPKGHEAEWLERYLAHDAEVRAHFADRPGDCLFLRLEDGLDVARICNFLGHRTVEMTPPRTNTRLRKRAKMAWWRLRRRLF